MIQVKLVAKDQSIRNGDESLLASWDSAGSELLWLDINGELRDSDVELLRSIGCHDLAILDAQRTRHPPKVEYFHNQTFILFRGICAINEKLDVSPLQICFFVGKNYLITVHPKASLSINAYWEMTSDTIDPLMLAAKIMHYSSGRYLEALLGFESYLNEQEDQLLGLHSEEAMVAMVSYRSKLLKLRRAFNYHERLADSLLSVDLELNRPLESVEITHVIRDLYDRCERLLSLSTMYYETCGDLIDGYISISSHKLNNTMRILTVITAIFIPLGFMAGLYGMNFEYMPELNWHYSYFVLLGVMGFTAVSLMAIFRRMRWI